MDFSENVKASEAADMAYARWYSQLPDEKKAEFFKNAYDLVAGKVRHDVKAENPFSTEADVTRRFVELTHKEEYSEEMLDFIRAKFAERSEEEWKQRFKMMKKHLNWSYDDIARFIGAGSGASVKASVNRKLPAFARLAVCVFEQMLVDENPPGHSG